MELENRIALLEQRVLDLSMMKFHPDIMLEARSIQQETTNLRAAATESEEKRLVRRVDSVRAQLLGINRAA